MCAIALVFTAFAPLLGTLAPFRSRAGAHSTLLFMLAVACCLSVSFPASPLDAVFGAQPYPVVLHPALLHPVLLSAAVASATHKASPEDLSTITRVRAGGAILALILGLPLATWLATIWPRSMAFGLIAAATIAVAILLIRTHDDAPISGIAHAERQAEESPPQTRLLRISIATVCVQSAAMFAVYSNALAWLRDQPGFDLHTSAFGMVLFGFGGIAGVALSERLHQRYSGLTILAQPLIQAVSYFFLLFAHEYSIPAIFALLFWGGSHASGLLLTRLALQRAAPRSPRTMTAIHASAASAGVILGAIGASLFSGTLGSAGIILCGLVLTLNSLVLVTAQLTEMEAFETVSGRATE